MKKIASCLVLFSTISIFNSCSSNKENEKIVYQCPMECEGEKTYDKMGTCSVCEMDLEEKVK